MVFSCCDLDREWGKDNIRCGPICWFPKGFSSDTNTMRKVLESVLDKCAASGLHVPAIHFDGQWHNICVRDINGKPLTVLQHQKDLWKTVESTSKAANLKEIKMLNKENMWSVVESNENDESPNRKIIVATNGTKVLPKISSSVKEYRLNENFRKGQGKPENANKNVRQEIVAERGTETEYYEDETTVVSNAKGVIKEPESLNSDTYGIPLIDNEVDISNSENETGIDEEERSAIENIKQSPEDATTSAQGSANNVDSDEIIPVRNENKAASKSV